MPEGVDYASTNVVAGTGLDLNYVQDRVYAYSGLKAALAAGFTVLNFQTGNKTIIGTMQLNAGVDDDTPTVGTETTANILLNGVSIGILKATTGAADNAPGSISQDLVLPPYTNVEVIMDFDSDENDRFGAMVFTGKIV